MRRFSIVSHHSAALQSLIHGFRGADLVWQITLGREMSERSTSPMLPLAKAWSAHQLYVARHILSFLQDVRNADG